MTASPDPHSGTPREEAERLVATAISAASMAARRIGRTRGPISSSSLGDALPGNLGALADALVDTARSAFGIGPNPVEYRVANDSRECCVCPVCRLITALRDPSPQLAERLARGAGDLAEGVASFMRAVANAGSPTSERPGQADSASGQPGPGNLSSDLRGSQPPETKPAAAAASRKPMAKKAVRPVARPVDRADGGRTDGGEGERP